MIHLLLQNIVWFFVKSLIMTYKVQWVGVENLARARAASPDNSMIVTAFHETVVPVMRAHAWTEPFALLSSRSKDGDYAAFVSKKMGFIAVRGSSKKRNKDKGGKEAMEEFLLNLRSGNGIGITIDGPKGPRHICKPGAVVLAQKSGAPILPTIGVSSSYWEFGSWDRFKLPKPFATITVIYGEPIFVPADSTPEEISRYCVQVSDVMKKILADFT